MPQWEYKRLERDGDGRYEGHDHGGYDHNPRGGSVQIDILNKYGKDGWELVSIDEKTGRMLLKRATETSGPLSYADYRIKKGIDTVLSGGEWIPKHLLERSRRRREAMEKDQGNS